MAVREDLVVPSEGEENYVLARDARIIEVPFSPLEERMAVESPSASFEPPLTESKSLWKWPSRSSLMPMAAPMARLAIKSTGKSDFGRLCTAAFAPRATIASPKALKRPVLYFPLIPRLTKPPIKEPTSMVLTFTNIPIMVTS